MHVVIGYVKPVKICKKGSPATAALTWLLWHWGKKCILGMKCLNLETQISEWKIRHADFVEGVRARSC